jgi:hypothetical protein
MRVLLDPRVWLSIGIWCAFVGAAVDYLRQSTRIAETITREYPDLWQKLFWFNPNWRWYNQEPYVSYRLANRAPRLERLILFGFPNLTQDKYPDLAALVSKCRVTAIGMILLLAVAIVSTALWPTA